MPRVGGKLNKLTYFHLRGKGEAIRLIFAYAKENFIDSRVEFAEWPEVKPKTPYGQLPILEVDGKVLAQSHAICRYLAKQFDLLPESDWDQAVADELVDLLADIEPHTSAVNPMREKDEEKRKAAIPAVLEKVYPLLDKVEARLQNNPSGWLVGDKISWVDLLFFAATEYFVTVLGKESFAKYGHQQALFNKVKELPQISEYLQKRPVTML